MRGTRRLLHRVEALENARGARSPVFVILENDLAVDALLQREEELGIEVSEARIFILTGVPETSYGDALDKS